MRNDLLTLIRVTCDNDEYGVPIQRDVDKAEVFCRVKSVGRQEFYAVGQGGTKPALKFIVCADEYDGQQIVEYNGDRYAIYRTYQTGETVELYTEVKIGTHNRG